MAECRSLFKWSSSCWVVSPPESASVVGLHKALVMKYCKRDKASLSRLTQPAMCLETETEHKMPKQNHNWTILRSFLLIDDLNKGLIHLLRMCGPQTSITRTIGNNYKIWWWYWAWVLFFFFFTRRSTPRKSHVCQIWHRTQRARRVREVKGFGSRPSRTEKKGYAVEHAQKFTRIFDIGTK